MLETRIYVIDLDKTETNVGQDTDTKTFIEISENLGSVYSLNGFIQALNDEEININNSFVKCVVMDTELGIIKEVGYEDIINPSKLVMDDVIQYIIGHVDDTELQNLYPFVKGNRFEKLKAIKATYSNREKEN